MFDQFPVINSSLTTFSTTYGLPYGTSTTFTQRLVIHLYSSLVIFPSKSDSNHWEIRIMCVSIKSTDFGENY